MKILIADKLSDNAVKALENMGASVRLEPDAGPGDLPGIIDDAEILIVRSTKVNRASMDSGSSLSLIIRAGAGVNTIDLEHASALGIHVANCPGKNADAVAELTIGHMIALDRNIVDNSVDLRRGVWNKKGYSKARGLKGRTLGILGMGSIGTKVAAVAQVMGLNVQAWSRSLTEQQAKTMGVGFCASPMDLARSSDIVTIHLAANSDTRHLVDRSFLEAMKDSAFLINTSRGEIMDTRALMEIRASKSLKVALDVYEDEPGASEKTFPHTDLAQVITGTHHIGASTQQAADAIADEVVKIVERYRSSGKPLHPVNARDKSSAQFNLVVRHFNKVGVLAAVLDALRNGNINVEEMENSIFSGGEAAVCTLKLDDRPSDVVLNEISSMENIIKASLK